MVPEWLVAAASPAGMKLWCLLWIYTGNGTHDGWPAQARLAADMACSTRTVQRTLEELIGLGAVHVEPRKGESSVYTMRWKRRTTYDTSVVSCDTSVVPTYDTSVVTPTTPVSYRNRQNEIEKDSSTTHDTTGHRRVVGDAPLSREQIREIRAAAAAEARAEAT